MIPDTVTVLPRLKLKAGREGLDSKMLNVPIYVRPESAQNGFHLLFKI